MAADDDRRNYAALARLYGEWVRGKPVRFALIVGGAVGALYGAHAAAQGALTALPSDVECALVVALWPLEGWRHPRLVVDSYRRRGSRPSVTGTERAGQDALTRSFLLVERLRDDPQGLSEPYLLVKDGVLVGRYTRVTRVRQVIDAAMPPLAPVIFASLRPGRVGPFDLIVLQALLEGLPEAAR